LFGVQANQLLLAKI